MGICGMAGAVNEWVNDWYQKDYDLQAVTDPQGPATGTQKTIRGGGAQGDPQYNNSIGRSGDDPSDPSGGFRCVINSTTSPAQLGPFAPGYPK